MVSGFFTSPKDHERMSFGLARVTFDRAVVINTIVYGLGHAHSVFSAACA